MRIELNCAVCGNNHFALDGEIADDVHIECADCGHKIGTMGELKQRIAAEVVKRSITRRDAERETESPPLIR
jgi:DNA-directed RNA polymerase subunit RPC12/RpoP